MIVRSLWTCFCKGAVAASALVLFTCVRECNAAMLSLTIGGPRLTSTGPTTMPGSLAITIADTLTAGNLKMTVTLNEPSTVKLDAVVLNLGTFAGPVTVTGIGAAPFVSSSFDQNNIGLPTFNSNSVIGFDLGLSLSQGNNNFLGGDTWMYSITGTGLTALLFNSTNGSSNGNYFAGAHIQNYPGNVSAVYGTTTSTYDPQAGPGPIVPEPSIAVLFGIGMISFIGNAAYRRRRKLV